MSVLIIKTTRFVPLKGTERREFCVFCAQFFPFFQPTSLCNVSPCPPPHFLCKEVPPNLFYLPFPFSVRPLPPFSTVLRTENGRESVSTKQQRDSYNSWGPSLLSQQLGTFSALTTVGDLLCSHNSWGPDKNRFSPLLSQQLGIWENRFSSLLSQQLGTWQKQILSSALTTVGDLRN